MRRKVAVTLGLVSLVIPLGLEIAGYQNRTLGLTLAIVGIVALMVAAILYIRWRGILHSAQVAYTYGRYSPTTDDYEQPDSITAHIEVLAKGNVDNPRMRVVSIDPPLREILDPPQGDHYRPITLPLVVLAQEAKHFEGERLRFPLAGYDYSERGLYLIERKQWIWTSEAGEFSFVAFVEADDTHPLKVRGTITATSFDLKVTVDGSSRPLF